MLLRLWSWLRLMLLSAGALLVVITFTPVVPWGASLLSTRWSNTDHDVLILLGGATVVHPGLPSGMLIGENTYWRVVYAVYAWRQGHFRTILVCGRNSAETIKPLLIAYGVPETAIVVENQSQSTHENALFAKPILAGMAGKFVLLTSDYHSLRASRCFAHEHIQVETIPCPDVLKRANSFTERWQCFWSLALELTKLVYYRAHGWI